MFKGLRYTLLFVVLVVLQLFVFNQIHFRGFLYAFPYIFFVLALPFGTSGRSVLMLSAAMGLAIDFFTGSMGVHTSAMVMLGYSRHLILPALAPQGDYENGVVPSVPVNGWGWYLRYLVFLTLIHHTILFFVESFSFQNLGFTFLNILLSSLFTIILLIILQISFRQRLG